MQFMSKSQLKQTLHKMTILDIIMLPKKEDYLRITTMQKIENGYVYIVDNGSGDSLIIFITSNGAYIKGFDHESKWNQFGAQFGADEWNEDFYEQVYKNAPSEFLELVGNEDGRNETTFCMWCVDDTEKWYQNEALYDDDDGGKEYLLGYIRKNAKEWCEWAEDYYEQELNMDIVKKVYNGFSIDDEIISKLNETRDIKEALQEINDLK